MENQKQRARSVYVPPKVEVFASEPNELLAGTEGYGDPGSGVFGQDVGGNPGSASFGNSFSGGSAGGGSFGSGFSGGGGSAGAANLDTGAKESDFGVSFSNPWEN